MTTTLLRLSGDHRAAYDRDGFVIVDDVFDRDELTALDGELDRLERPGDHHDGVGFQLALGERSALTRAWCAEPRLLALVGDLVHPGIAIYSAKLVTKPPLRDDASTVCHWHQDDAYYQQNSQSTVRMSVWFPLTDAGTESGCLRVVPGSHRRGLAPWSLQSDGSCRQALQRGCDPRADSIEVPVRAGSVLLFHALLWHASPGNRTSQRRRAFIVSYQDARAGRGNGSQHRILVPAPAAL